NIALSLSAALGDLELAKRSLKAMGVGVLLAATLSFLVGVLLDVDPTSRELAGRTHVDVSDIVLALAAGAAGALAFTTGVSSVVMGVMVAVALLPPLVVAGLMAGSGHGGEALRAFLLALTNVTCINLAAMATFYAQRVRPRTWWEAEKARRAVRFAAGAWVLLLALLVSLILLGHVRGA
ncbi:MAG: TIGR00341 family protein, partial [Planctomycetes bacterium]|nr:TIGR00341 family protein [Planctomycetota bacterium]